MERKVRDSCGKSESRGDPTGAKAPRRLPDRPRKASAWSENHITLFQKSGAAFRDCLPSLIKASGLANQSFGKSVAFIQSSSKN
ncbi:hypothetical protein [Peribacillus frigoritolerans]|uniref:Uncharacterized protein n=1 Tax=Peribacillus castrilensis TaxID=2897690 RepID=A0AAW9N5C0_9BACI|nr:hypothetical protein [Peribacillus castrilensis]